MGKGDIESTKAPYNIAQHTIFQRLERFDIYPLVSHLQLHIAVAN